MNNKKYVHICAMCSCDFEDDSRSKYICPDCDSKMNMIKKLKMLDKAEYDLTHIKGRIRMKLNVNLDREKTIVRSRILNGIDVFSSKLEVIIALQLEHRNIKYQTQKKIGGKRADFYLPNMKIILEVDGELYHTDENETFIRDRAIMRELGEEWEIVHIAEDIIPRYTWNLHEALPYVISQREEYERFRDTRDDTFFIEQFYGLHKYLRRYNE